jgi:DNA (cytosine-5)-methyltransferase 1
MMRALDLFSAAAGGWSLGLHRARFVTVAACEIVEWRRILYAENNPHVRLYGDIRSLTAARLVSDLGILPDIIVGSPPCQDISSANAKGRGIDGERSGLYLEAVRLVGDCRPRWFAFENSSNLRTRGADRLLDELETLGYACEPCVVGADNVGANHVRKRSWLIGYDPEQLAHAHLQPVGRPEQSAPQSEGNHLSGVGVVAVDRGRGAGAGPLPRGHGTPGDAGDAEEIRRGTGWPGRRAEPAPGPCEPSRGNDANAGEAERRPTIEPTGNRGGTPGNRGKGADRHAEPSPARRGDAADANEARRQDGRMERGLRTAEIADDGRGDERRDDGLHADSDGEPTGAIVDPEMGGSAGAGGNAAEPWADWNGGLAHHLLLDDGLSAWVADTRIALGSPKGTSAASLIVEAFGDAVLPQIPEAIGRAILRTEAALDLAFGRGSIDITGDER